MKLIAFFAFALLAVSLAFGETVAWKGMEFGGEENPKWLLRLTQKNDETQARKKFGISAEERIVFGMGIAPTLEEARTASQAACLKKILGGQENDVRFLNGLQPVFEHWVQDDKTGFTVVSIYTQEK